MPVAPLPYTYCMRLKIREEEHLTANRELKVREFTWLAVKSHLTVFLRRKRLFKK